MSVGSLLPRGGVSESEEEVSEADRMRADELRL